LPIELLLLLSKLALKLTFHLVFFTRDLLKGLPRRLLFGGHLGFVDLSPSYLRLKLLDPLLLVSLHLLDLVLKFSDGLFS
jgi:hypothetical protein